MFGKDREVEPSPIAPRTAAPAHVPTSPISEPPVVEEPGVYNHPPFTEEVRDLLREIKMSLDEVYCLSVPDWEDRFRREADTVRAIASYVVISRIYQQMTSDGRHDHARKRELFHVLAACPLFPRDQVLDHVPLTVLAKEEALAAIESYDNIGPHRTVSEK